MKRLCLLLAALLLNVGAEHSSAQSYPSRPVRIVVGSSAGGTLDLLARAISVKMSEGLGQPVIVENRPGTSTAIAEEHVVKSAPDGHTLIMSGLTLATNPYLRVNLPYDPLRDLTQISLVATNGNALVVNTAVPAKTVGELIEYSKTLAQPLFYGSGAQGSSDHLAAEMFNQMTGTRFQQIPYKGAAPALQDLMAGQIHMIFINIPAAIGLIRSGKIRPVAVTTMKRSPQLPDVPTVAESGIPGLAGYEMQAWFGLAAPVKVSAAIINRIHAEVVKTVADQDVRDRFANLGFEPVGSTPEQFRSLFRNEYERLGKVIRAAGMKAE